MPNNIAHFAIHADDIERARRFYAAVFGWRFEAWGPPGFYRVHTGTEAEPGIEGALHGRLHAVSGTGMIGYECTVGVDDLAPIQAAVVANGGRIVGRSTIPTVGDLLQFEDTEGNVAAAMKYDR